MIRARLAVLLTLGLAGCATVSEQLPSPPPPPPPPVEVSSINGLGAFRTYDGGYAACAGLSVLLMPETSLTRARMLALYGSDEHIMAPIAVVKARQVKLGPPPAAAVNATQCDGDNRFGFSDLDAGGYFLIARERVRTAAGGQEDMVVMQHLYLRTGEARQVRLAQ